MTIDTLNGMSEDAAIEALMNCCHCPAWAQAVADGRPYPDMQDLQQSALQAWHNSSAADALAAFAAHPLIGDVELLRQKYADRANAEQGQVLGADESTLQGLAELNKTYHEKFGFIFIICATGKSAEEMLAALQARIGNTAEEEMANARAEQAKITALRITDLWGADVE